MKNVNIFSGVGTNGMFNGQNYVQVDTCKKTGAPKMAPFYWNKPLNTRPTYATCRCCPAVYRKPQGKGE